MVAYLVPNLDNKEVKRAAIDNMFQSSGRLFGNPPSVQQIETRPPEGSPEQSAAYGGFDEYVDGTYKQAEAAAPPVPPEPERNDFYCDKCGVQIEEKVWDYSVEHYERPLCYKCQKIVRGNGR